MLETHKCTCGSKPFSRNVNRKGPHKLFARSLKTAHVPPLQNHKKTKKKNPCNLLDRENKDMHETQAPVGRSGSVRHPGGGHSAPQWSEEVQDCNARNHHCERGTVSCRYSSMVNVCSLPGHICTRQRSF